MSKKVKADVKDIELSDENSTSTLIFCHGLGDNATSWLYMAKELRKNLKHFRVILTNAPMSKVSVNKGIVSPSWFDILEIPVKNSSPENGIGIDESIKNIHKLIESEIQKGIPANRIFLGGFSQGATLSLISGLKYEYNQLGGIIMLSGWAHKNLNLIGYKNSKIPILICHGDKDKVVLYENATELKSNLDKYNFQNSTLKTYSGMGHNNSTKEIGDLFDWLENITNTDN